MNARFRTNPIVRLLASLKLMVFLVLVFALASGVATFIESAYGTPAARALVYNALWFEVTIGLLIVNLIALLLARWPYRPSQYGFVLIHISVIVILISAAITRFFGYEGMMHIREGSSSSSIQSTKDYVELIDLGGDRMDGFPVLLWKAGPAHASGKATLGGETYHLEVKEFWPHFSEQLMESDSGPAAINFAVAGGNGMERRTLTGGESIRSGDVQITFHDGALPPAGATAPLGSITARVAGKVAVLPVSRDATATAELAGYSLRVTEFHPDYARRNDSPEPTAMNNPMARVEITGPDGATAERVLFAFFPDFGMDHPGSETPMAELALVYDYGRRLEFGVSDGKLAARASFPLEVVDMGSGQADHEQPGGETFSPAMMTLHRSGNFSLVITAFFEHAAMQPAASADENSPAAARVAVRGPGGEQVEKVLRRGEPQRVSLGGKDFDLSFGPRMIDVPYRVELDDFLLLTYPGSNNPASYESHVKLYDEDAGINGRPVRIYMNHPLTYKGFKHFQSSYDPDHRGTVLSVNHDPGKWPTYFGYILIGLGFLLILFKGLMTRGASGNGSRKEKS